MAARYYDILGVSRFSNIAAITLAYRRRALALHPDKPGGSCEQFQALGKAFELLSHPERRSEYDLSLQRRGCSDGLPLADRPIVRNGACKSGMRARSTSPPSETMRPDGMGASSMPRKEEPNGNRACLISQAWSELLGCKEESCAAVAASLSFRVLEALLTQCLSDLGSNEVQSALTCSTAGKRARDSMPDCSEFGESLMAACNAEAMSEDDEEPQRKRRRRSLPLPRGIHKGGTPTRPRYYACVRFCNLTLTSLAPRSLLSAIDCRISLVRLKKSFERARHEGNPVGTALQAALNASWRGEKQGVHRKLVLLFTATVPFQGHLAWSPPSNDLEMALNYRSQLLALHASGANHSEAIAWKEREMQEVETNRERIQVKLKRLQFLSKILTSQMRGLLRGLRLRTLPSGLDVTRLHEAVSEDVSWFAFLLSESHPSATGIRRKLCEGPLRQSKDDALEDLRSLKAKQDSCGDEAAVALARRLDIDAMLGRLREFI